MPEIEIEIMNIADIITTSVCDSYDENETDERG